MRIYEVGGAVRDELLGLPVQDRDYVVVGATPAQMVAAGYRPVGRDFPVFLHPDSHDEYALARTERKVAPGYAGFHFHTSPEVTLEDDLRRRDLTINAMARDETGRIVDPHGGQADLRDRVLRHVSEAFEEDPVRVLRLARFAARFHTFTVAPETVALMRTMVDKGEVDALVPERTWQELARGLMERHPSRMFAVLRECGALARVFPELDRLWGVPQRADHHPEVDTGVHTMLALEHCAARGHPLSVRFAALVHDLGKALTPAEVLPRHIGHEQRSARLVEQVCARLRAPNDVRDLARLVAAEHANVHRSDGIGAAALVRLLERCDALRKSARFEECLLACEADHRGRQGLEDRPYPQADRLRRALAAAQSVDAGRIAQAVTAAAAARAQGQGGDGASAHAARGADGPGADGPVVTSIKARVHAARAEAVRQALGLAHEAPAHGAGPAGAGHG